jgi:hypothetical protein
MKIKIHVVQIFLDLKLNFVELNLHFNIKEEEEIKKKIYRIVFLFIHRIYPPPSML